MGRASLAVVLVPYGYAEADEPPAAANTRFHDGARMQISDRHRCPLAPVGKVGAADARVVALSLQALRGGVGAGGRQASRSPLGPAPGRPVGARIDERSQLHVVQVGFYVDPQR